MVRRGLIALALLGAFSAAGEPPPSFTSRNGVVSASLSTAILQNASVKKQLASGLTTTFLLAAREGKNVSGARAEIRYDLWDEVWLVKRVEFDGTVDRQRLAGVEALEKWWRAPVRLLTTNADRITLQLDLTVLPFSSAEEDDARQWITKSAGVGTRGAGTGLVETLIGTTISAKPITSFRWKVDLSLR